MGKRIPKSSKHKKLKFVDPCYSGQGPQSKKRKNFYNEPPSKKDTDDTTYSAYEKIVSLKNQAKQKRKKKRKVKKDDFIVVKNTIIDTAEINENRGLPNTVKQKSHESEDQFFKRLQRMTNSAISEAKIEEKFNIEVVSIDKKGNAEYVTAKKEVSEKKREKRKKHQIQRKEKKRQKVEDKKFDLKKEKVQFGEVVSAPPILSAKPRKAPVLMKAGKRELALKSLLPSAPKSSEDKVAPLSKKWKSLAPVRRQMVESERLRAVQMYRLMKNKSS